MGERREESLCLDLDFREDMAAASANNLGTPCRLLPFSPFCNVEKTTKFGIFCAKRQVFFFHQ